VGAGQVRMGPVRRGDSAPRRHGQWDTSAQPQPAEVLFDGTPSEEELKAPLEKDQTERE
jgi:hypothetical protein